MKLTLFTLGSALSAHAAVIGERAGNAVVGKPEGFASGTTGGGSAACAAPSDITQLKTWLTDSTARCIVIDKEYNFKTTEGSATENGCRPASNKCPGSGGQDAINQASWCTNGNAGAGSKTISVTYDKAGIAGINVGSNKSIIGKFDSRDLHLDITNRSRRRKQRCSPWQGPSYRQRSKERDHSEHPYHRPQPSVHLGW
jgi:pectin lyase